MLIHVGFAMSKIDEEEAALALASLQLMGQAYDDELEAFWSSRIESESVGSESLGSENLGSEAVASQSSH